MDILVGTDYLGQCIATDKDNYCGCCDCPMGFGDSPNEAIEDLIIKMEEAKYMLYSFDDLKFEWLWLAPKIDFTKFLENFVQVYNDNHDLLGYERKDIASTGLQ